MKTKVNVNDFHNKLLLIEGDPADAKVIQAALADVRYGPFDVESVRQLSDAYERLGKEGIAAVLFDLFLPHSQGIETLNKLLLAAPPVPLFVLSGPGDEDIPMQTVQGG